MTKTPYKKMLVAVLAFTAFFNACKTDGVKPAIKLTHSATSLSAAAAATPLTVPLKCMFGINAYAWNFLSDPGNPNNVSVIYQHNMSLIKSFSQVRHYLDWSTLEASQGSYTYNPATQGSWNLDAIYQADHDAGITTLVDIKTCPNWFLASYPAALQDGENVPAPYGSDLSNPASYIEMGKMAFQFAARYGSNVAVPKTLVTVNATPRWTGDPINVVRIGTGLVKYIECNNEPDKWWKGPATKQTAAQYAANMSAFYDGNMGKLGNNVGVKTADPNMIVVMGGIATDSVQWVKDMITWCAQNRGYKADGSVNLCFDVINYHYYNNSGGSTGASPEQSKAAAIADNFAALSKSIATHPQVWVTESGYDVNAGSVQRAPIIGTKSSLLVQGDWILRTCFLYLKHGISRLFFYQLFDDTANSSALYATSGLCEPATATSIGRRPAANYIAQTLILLGNYKFVKTISTSPMVDEYINGSKIIYALYMPTATGAKSNYSLAIGASSATIYTLNPTGSLINSSTITATSNKVNVAVSETPVFVSAVGQ